MHKRKIAATILILLAFLVAIAGMQPPATLAAGPLAVTDTPTPEDPTPTDAPTATMPPTSTVIPSATATSIIFPPVSSPTSTATQPVDETPTATQPVEETPTATPQEPRTRQPTQAPILPQTGEIPPDSPMGPLGILSLGVLIGLGLGFGGRKLLSLQKVKGSGPFLSSRR